MAQVALSINHFKQAGGMESYAFDVVQGLSHRGITPKVYASRFDETLDTFTAIKPCLIAQSKIPKKIRPFVFTWQLAKHRTPNEKLIACNLVNHSDIQICGGTHLGYLRAIQKSPNLIDRLTIRRNQTSYQTARFIVAHSELMKRELIELYGVSPEKIRVIYPPISSRFQAASSSNLRQEWAKYGVRDEDTVFLFPSTGHHRKGFDLLANFFEKSHLPIKLLVAGSPLPRPMRNVIELGFCHNMPELYHAADFTILASFYEPFGLVGIESVLSGTKVVLANNIACCEVLNENAGFFFNRKNPNELAQAIEQAVQNKHNHQHKIKQAQTALLYNSTLENHIQQLLQLIEN